MSMSGPELLKSFDLLPEPEKRQVASEIIRRIFAYDRDVDEAQLAAVYAEFADEDRCLAEEGMEDYERGLLAEDAR
jgi:hypothetical protein